MSRRMPHGGRGPEWPDEPDDGQAYPGEGQSARRDGYGPDGYHHNGNANGASGQNQQQRWYGQQPSPENGGYGSNGSYRNNGSHQNNGSYGNNGSNGGYRNSGVTRGYPDPRGQGDTGRYEDPRRPGQTYQLPERPARPAPAVRKVRFRRARRLFRYRVVRAISAVVAILLVWASVSLGQATFKNTGQSQLANAAEWFRDHGFGPLVTFGEWLTYNPPPKGGKPSFSLAVPSGEAVSSGKPTATKAKNAFVPDIPATLKSLAGSPIAGEGQWRVVEKVKGEPAILTTFLRDATYTGQVNGIASIDQRLVKFSLRPGTEDPGTSQNWGVPAYIPAGQRTGLLATFNGGFKLNSAGGGYYLNGVYDGSLQNGAASVVYYKNGSIKIGEWGRDFTMNSSIAGVRQNLKLLVDHGQVSASANSDVMANWGATLGGGYYVWRSGLGITKDGRIVYVYGSALNAQDLGLLLQRAGAVEGMQLDINPAWMKFDYYQGNPSDPTPTPLLPTQQPSPYSYYTPSTRDFTAVYAR